jgi:hypothetical protein
MTCAGLADVARASLRILNLLRLRTRDQKILGGTTDEHGREGGVTNNKPYLHILPMPRTTIQTI